MPTQLSINVGDVKGEHLRLKRARLELTARERNQQVTVDSLAGMLRAERKTLRELRKQKAAAEDAEELFRAGHDLEI
jgi:hypothetical protein